MPGYDLNVAQVKNKILFVKYKCHSCMLTLRDAVQPMCGHWLCETCAETLLSLSSPTCPREDCCEALKEDDSAEDEPAYFPDNFVRREIKRLEVICRWSQSGCEWSGELNDYSEHLLYCMHAIRECPKCGETLPAGVQDHQCPQGISKCPLAPIGCTHSLMMKKEKLEDHLCDTNTKHFQLLVGAITDIKSKLSKTSSQDFIHAVAGEESDNEDNPVYNTDKFQTRMKGFGLGLTPLGGHEVTTDSPRKSFDKKINLSLLSQDEPPSFLYGGSSVSDYISQDKLTNNIMAKVKEILKVKDEEILSLKTNLMKLEKTVKTKHAELEDRDFRLSLIENSNYDGTMVWKIPQFSQRMSDARSGKYTSIFSLPFYTSRYGYKMCLRLYILGDGIGKGNCMSLFFVIMKGEFDNILQWPFTHKVTFRLVSQGSKRDIVDTFQPEPSSSSFRKPKSDMNIASGCPRFISHDDLSDKSFVVDDTIFIKCEVDTSTIRHL